MGEAGINQLFNLSKTAKKNKDYILERKYLEESLKISPENVKVINALIRNLKKQKCNDELKKWLYKLYELKPSGVVLSELIRLEKISGNKEKVGKLLIEDLRINPNSKKIKRRIFKEGIILKTNMSDERYKEIVELINTARSVIYSEEEYEIKKSKLLEILIDQNKLICVCLLSEFYINESKKNSAINIIKNYKKELIDDNDKEKIKILNELYELVKKKRVMRFNWNDFWQKNIKSFTDIKEDIKLFIKYM